mgnify:CR=1 FL=1
MTTPITYTGYTTQHLTSLVDELTGEVDLRYNLGPIEKDFFIPSPDYESVDMDTLPGTDNLSDVDNLHYFFEKFIKTVETKKPNTRLTNQLKILIDSTMIKLLMEDARTTKHNILDNNFKMTFKIPVGNINKDEQQQQSWIKKLKKMIKL